MSVPETILYPTARLPFLPNYKRYTLELKPRSSGETVVVQATILKKVGYDFEDPDRDSTFNLSASVGFRDGSLVWGLSGFETSVGSISIRSDPHTHERYLAGTPLEQDTAGGGQRPLCTLNLDKYLDIVEYVEDKCREIRRKLGRKPYVNTRSVVLCFDGTSNHFSSQNTNVVKLVELLKKNDPAKQMVYYQAGVGTYSPPGFLTTTGLKIAAKADEGIAWQIIDGYKYLMETYQTGDQISIFGFSRGAYTARALAGMIHSVGLLPKHNIEQVPFAYQIYENSKEEESPDGSEPKTVKESARPENVNPEEFKRAFCIPIEIHFLGVWDTVGSVGALTRKTLPWIEWNPSVEYFRQALALDENRGNFIPSVWDHSRTQHDRQNALEVWFKGGHADIGGGAPLPKNNLGTQLLSRPQLSNIPLRWMVRQCLTCSGVLFDPDAMRRYREAKILEPRRVGTETDSDEDGYLGEIEKLDETDVGEDPYIALEDNPWWNILEYLPVPKLSQREEKRSQPKTAWSPNQGAPRSVNRQQASDPIRLHSSVYLALKSTTNQNYKPTAEWYNWPKNTWPEIEEGTMSSVMTLGDEDSTDVRDKLAMTWRPPKPAGGFFSRFFGGTGA